MHYQKYLHVTPSGLTFLKYLGLKKEKIKKLITFLESIEFRSTCRVLDRICRQ